MCGLRFVSSGNSASGAVIYGRKKQTSIYKLLSVVVVNGRNIDGKYLKYSITCRENRMRASPALLVPQVSYHTRNLLCVLQLHDEPIMSLTVTEWCAITCSADKLLRLWPLDFSEFLMEAAHEVTARNTCKYCKLNFLRTKNEWFPEKGGVEFSLHVD